MGSVVNLRNKIPNNHSLSKLLKDVNIELTAFEVTELDWGIVESNMLDNQKNID